MMNIKMNNIAKVIAGGLLLGSVACTDLEEKVYSDVTADNFFQTEEEVASGVGAIYTQWNDFIGEPWSLVEVASDEVVVPTRGADWFDNGNWQRIHLHAFDAGDDRLSFSWNVLFRPVNTANRLIFQFEQQEGGDPDLIAAAVAQLRGMRALAYFYLMDLYGNVPIVDRFDVPADFAPSNGSGSDMAQRVEVYNWIVSELEAIKDDLATEQTYGQFNYWTCQALLAKLYLNRGVYTEVNPTQGSYKQGDLDAAEAAIADILNNGPFSLSAGYFDNFNTNNEGSPENIFVFVYDQVFSGGFNLVQRTLHYGSQATYDLQQQPWNGYCTLEEFYNMFDRDPGANVGDPNEFVDLRGNMFIRGRQLQSNGEDVTDDSFEEGKDVLPADNPATLWFDPVINEFEPTALRQAGARIGKYEFARGATPDLSNDYPVFRLGDLILNWAEIQIVRDGTVSGTALALVNQMRSRAGVPDYSAAELTLDELLRERGREVAFEYWRRNDLIRFGKFNEEWWGKAANQNAYTGNTSLYGANAGVTNPDGVIVTSPAGDAGLTPDRTVFPVPRAQLQANPNLRQNPGYSN